MMRRTAGRLVGERALVEIAEDRAMRAGEQIERDLTAPLLDARVVELAADETEERGLDLRISELGAAGDEAHDRLGDFLRDKTLAGLQHRGERLRAGHRREPQAVLRDARHLLLEALERGEVVLAQRDQHPVVAAREIETLGGSLVLVELRFEFLRRAVLDQIGQIRDEARGACAPEVIALREGEDLLELVEDEQRNQRRARLIAQHIIAVVQEFPQRLALRPPRRPGSTRPERPGVARIACLICSAGSGASRDVVDAHVDRAIALAAQPRHEAGAQDRGLAEARLAEQHREELALHAPRELGDLLFAAEEVTARLLGEGGEARATDCAHRPRRPARSAAAG